MAGDNEILALIDRRMKAAEKQFLASPEVVAFMAREKHMLMEHGTLEPCKCPGLMYGYYYGSP